MTTSTSPPFSASSQAAPPSLDLGGAVVLATGRAEGDVSKPEVRARIGGPKWTLVRQVHGTDVVVVDGPGGALETEADALVTTTRGVPLAVLGADCGLIGLYGDGVVAAVHAGWRGLLSGVIEEALSVMAALGARRVEAVLGPCISPECYAFSARDLVPLVERFGPSVATTTARGAPAFDLPGAIRTVLAGGGVRLAGVLGGCTACGGYYSFRARGDTARQGLVITLGGSS